MTQNNSKNGYRETVSCLVIRHKNDGAREGEDDIVHTAKNKKWGMGLALLANEQKLRVGSFNR